MGSVTTGHDKRPGFEREWANRHAHLALNAEDRAIWESSRYTLRPHAYNQKIFIVWTFRHGQPQVRAVYSVRGVSADFHDGLTLSLYNSTDKTAIKVGHTPTRLGRSKIIAWLPFFNELRYSPPDWENYAAATEFGMRLSVCFKMRHKPEEQLEEGVDYLTELHKFREHWPQFADVRF